MSCVACSTTIAQVCRSTWGETCLPCSVEHFRCSRFGVTPQNVCDSPSAEGFTCGRSQRAQAKRPVLEWPTKHEVPQPLSSKEATRVRGGPCHARGCSPTGVRHRRGASLSVRRLGAQRTPQDAAWPDLGLPSRVDGSGASSRACISSWTRYATRRVSVFLKGIARTRRTCSMAAGSRCCRNRKNERMAARRMFRVSAELPRVVSRCSRNALISAASNCSSIRADGATLSFWEANSNND